LDDTQICNMALSSIGTRSTIASLSEDSTEAETCQLWYNTLRDSLLRDLPWNWARRQVALAVYKAAAGTQENPQGALPQPPLPWLYSYAYPSDCLDARYILPLLDNGSLSGAPPPLTTGNNLQYRYWKTPAIKMLIAGDVDTDNNPLKVILCNQKTAQLVYTGKVTDPNVWDIDFVTALVGRLAQNISFPLSGDKGLTKFVVAAGLAAEAKAEASNGNEAMGQSSIDPDWLTARGYCDDLTHDGDETYLNGGAQDIS
jgi:hypothetical protein